MRQFGGMGGGGMGGAAAEVPVNDTAEQVQISSLALLKMLKHGEFIFKAHATEGTPPRARTRGCGGGGLGWAGGAGRCPVSVCCIRCLYLAYRQPCPRFPDPLFHRVFARRPPRVRALRLRLAQPPSLNTNAAID